jgi:hypothetical protein
MIPSVSRAGGVRSPRLTYTNRRWGYTAVKAIITSDYTGHIRPPLGQQVVPLLVPLGL